MGTLHIWLFGRLRLDHEDFAVDPALLNPVQGLLAYFLLHRERLHSRDTLAGIFWGDRACDKARRCLNTALWREQREIEGARPVLRGAVEHVASGERRAIMNLSGLVALLQPSIDAMGIDIEFG
jgi:DNA-binding SARP family transcriptional activator